MSPLRLKRVLDVTMEQCRSLRVRSLMGYLGRQRGNGAYVWINSRLDGQEPLRSFAATFPTTLRKLSAEEFEKSAHYGYLVADARLSGQIAEERSPMLWAGKMSEQLEGATSAPEAAQLSDQGNWPAFGADVQEYYHDENA